MSFDKRLQQVLSSVWKDQVPERFLVPHDRADEFQVELDWTGDQEQKKGSDGELTPKLIGQAESVYNSRREDQLFFGQLVLMMLKGSRAPLDLESRYLYIYATR